MFFLQILVNGLVVSIQVALLATSLHLIHRVAKTYLLSLSAVLVLAAYGTHVLLQLNLPLLLAMLGGIAVSALFNWLSFFLLKAYIEKDQDLLGLLVSLALGLGMEAILAMAFGSKAIFLIDTVLPTYEWAGIIITQVGFWTLICGVVIGLAAFISLHLLPLGRAIRAVQQHGECATLVGIQERKVQWMVFGVAGAMAGLMGILTSMNTALTPHAGFDFIILAFAAVLVGGVKDLRGILLGSFLLVLTPELLTSFEVAGVSISYSWYLAIVFAVATLVLLLKPQGILSLSIRKS